MAARATSKPGRKKVRCPRCTAFFSEPAKPVFECPICACRLLANGMIAVPESLSPGLKNEDSAQIKTVTEPLKMQSSTSIRKEGSFSIGNGTTREENSISCEQESVDSRTQIYKENQQQLTVEVRPVLMSGNSNEQPHVGSAIEGVIGANGVRPPIHSVSKQGDIVGRNERVESLQLSGVEGGKEDGNLGSTIHQCPSDDMSKDKALTTEDERVEEKGCLINGASSNRRHLQSQMFQTSRSEFSFKYSLRGASLMESDRTLPDRKHVPASKFVSSGAALPDTEKTDVPLCTPLRVRISKSQEESSDQSEHGRHSFGSETYSDDDDGSGSDFDFPAPWAEGLQDIVLPTSFGQSEVSHFDSKAVVSAAPHQLELQDNDDAIAEAEVSLKVEHTGEARERESELRDEEPSHGFAQPVSMHEKKHVSLPPPEQVETASELRPPSRDTQILDVSNSACMLSDNLVVAQSNEARESSDGEEEGEAWQQENVANMEPSANTQQEAFKPSGAAFRPSGVVVSDGVGGAHDSHSIFKTGGFQTVDLQKDVGPVHNHQNLMSSEKMKNELFSSVNDQCADGLPLSLTEMEQSSGVSNAMDGNLPDDRQFLSSPIEHAEMEEDLYRLPLEAHVNGSILGGSSHSALWAEEETAVSVLSDNTLVNASKARLYHERRNHHKSSLHGKANGRSGSRLAGSDTNEDLFMSGQERSLWGPAASQDPPPQATSEHGDWEGHITAGAEQTGHPALHKVERDLGLYYQYPVNNSLGYALANPQPYALTNQIYPYQLPAQSLVCAAALQNHAFSHCGYHAMSPACMLCSYHQHPHMQPQHIGHCGACLIQSGSIGYNSGHDEYWNSHQAHHGSASSCAGSLVDCPQACLSRDQIQRHDFSNIENMSQTSSVRNATQYPPLPNSGAAPYVTCKGCNRVLQVPSDLRMNSGTMQKLRCGACGKVTKFSINYHNQQKGAVSSIPPPEMDLMGGVKSISFVDYGNRSRQAPVNLEIERMKSPYKHDMLKGNSASYWANNTSPQVNGITGSRALEQSSQGRDSFRVQQPSGDTSLNTSNQPSISGTVCEPSLQHASSQGGVMSPRSAAATSSATSYGFERLKVNSAVSFHPTVDEKEEGLDFGAPRISDGDSLDQSESRMRSPENYQLGHEAHHISQGGAVMRNQPSEQLSDWNDDHTDLDKKPGSPLLVLMNQESTRFRLNIQPRVPLQGSGSAAWSPASDSVLYGNSSNDHPQIREQSKVRSHGSPGQHFVSKGPKYIAGLLRRSLRDFGKGGQ